MGLLLSELNCTAHGDNLYDSSENPVEEQTITGRWKDIRGDVHIVGVDAVQWRNGVITKLRKRRRFTGMGSTVEFLTQVNGTVYTGTLASDGKLLWSDGDAWVRDLREPETRTYSCISGAFEGAQ